MKFNKNLENFLTNRPLFARFESAKYGIPILWKSKLNIDNASLSNIINFTNIKNRDISNDIVECFSFDYKLNPLWNKPFKKIAEFKSARAVLTPDFSITSSMKEAQIIENTFKNRWLGCFYQQYSIDVIPTVSWGEKNTYDICSQGLVKYNPLAISTVCANDKKVFLKGFKYFINKFEPEYIICYGKIIEGMYGKIIQYDYEDVFSKNKKHEKIKLFDIPRLIEIQKSDVL